MKFAAATAVLAATAAVAAPLSKRAVTDTDILQYALTLEHLENYFYSHFLGQFDQAAFEKAGYPAWVRNRVTNIAGHEAQHVALLSGALGAAATQPCTYSFPSVTDPKSFLGLATVIENVGVSAYLGAAQYISEAAYVTVAGSILTTESRHQTWLSSAVDKNQPWSGPEDTPLDFDEVYSIASAFITSCPSTNPTLPVKAFPTLAIAADGTLTTSANLTGAYVQLNSGLDTNVFPVMNGKVSLPATQGIAYAILVSTSNNTMVSDATTLAGPAIISTPFNSATPNVTPNF